MRASRRSRRRPPCGGREAEPESGELICTDPGVQVREADIIRSAFLKVLIAGLFLIPAAAPAAVAGHGAFVHEDFLKAEPTGYLAANGDLFHVDLNTNERVDATLQILRIYYNSAHDLVRDELPYDVGLHVFAPNEPPRVCRSDDGDFLASEDTKHRSRVAAFGSGEGDIWVSADFVTPPATIHYRLTVTVDGTHGADRVTHPGGGPYGTPTTPVCQLT